MSTPSRARSTRPRDEARRAGGFSVAEHGDHAVLVFARGVTVRVAASPSGAAGRAAGAAADGAIVSPMPGRIISVEVAARATGW